MVICYGDIMNIDHLKTQTVGTFFHKITKFFQIVKIYIFVPLMMTVIFCTISWNVGR